MAVTDYARYNREILGNESILAYNAALGYEKDMGSEMEVLNELAKEFTIVGYNRDLEKWIDEHKIDTAYFIKAGNIDGELPPNPANKKLKFPTNCRTAVHAVFQFYEPHGDRYAYISKWLSEEMSQGTVPFVPHIVQLPTPTKNFKEALGIREDQIVIGRIGGYYTFDIPGVKEYIKRLVNDDVNGNFVFLFVGTEPFIQHPNVKFINEFQSPQKKANFISTCDAMLHARQRGESFGLSIAEFLSLNKPVLAWNGGHDKNHLDMLKDSGTLYSNENDLNYMIHNLKDFDQDWTKRVEEFKPQTVMKKFNEVFLT